MKKSLGKQGEDIAVHYLQRKGYRIVQRNYHSRYGEIDIVCRKNQDMIFVEVKTRSSDRYGSAEEAVTAVKQQRLRKTALTYLQQLDRPVRGLRFDVITVRFEVDEVVINHIENAF